MRFRNTFVRYGGTFACLTLVALALWPFHPDTRPLTAAACLSLVLMGVAINWGTGPALLGSIASALYINFYYVPPIDRFSFSIGARRRPGGSDRFSGDVDRGRATFGACTEESR